MYVSGCVVCVVHSCFLLQHPHKYTKTFIGWVLKRAVIHVQHAKLIQIHKAHTQSTLKQMPREALRITANWPHTVCMYTGLLWRDQTTQQSGRLENATTFDISVSSQQCITSPTPPPSLPQEAHVHSSFLSSVDGKREERWGTTRSGTPRGCWSVFLCAV